MEFDWGSPKFVAEQFRRWYETNSSKILPPTELKMREFAFLQFGGKTMFRHIKFQDVYSFQRYFTDYFPLHCYHSSSYYQNPDADMAKKGWIGSDLVFDIDADHFNLPCQHEHDRWVCRTCGEEGTGKPPEVCKCGKATFEEETWLCESCLQAAKHEMSKLIDILLQDFGFTPEDLVVNFSGNRGYHVHVRSTKIRSLDQYGRREIVDYILGTGLKAEYFGFNGRSKGGSILADVGWRGRAGRALYDYIESSLDEEIKSLKLGRNLSTFLTKEKAKTLTILEESHPSLLLKTFSGSSKIESDIEKLMELAIKEQAANIDTVVTTDIHRLIRLPNTLHGKTGWKVQTITLGSLSDYDPMSSAIAFRSGELDLFVHYAPKIRIDDKVYGPYNEEKVTVPMAVGLFLLCKKRARVVS